MAEDSENDKEIENESNKKRLTPANRSLAASVITVTCDKCGRSFTKLEFSSHRCG